MTVEFATTGQPVVVEVVRSGVVEGRHHGAVVALNADGAVAWSVGDVRRPILPRSCMKPLQALAMVSAGLTLPPQLLALACASHSGEGFQIEGVRQILAGGGVRESALQCPPDLPLDSAVAEAWVRAGGERAPVLMNCSGKHAAMLATCVKRGWPIDTYLEPTHPLQEAIRAAIEQMTGEETFGSIDGCGAPLLSTSLVGLARAFSLLARGREPATADGHEEPSAAAEAVAHAIRAHPAWVSGSTRDERMLLVAIPGLIGKAGAEANYVVALPDGRALALKIDDGAPRARRGLMAAALQRWGVDVEPGVDTAAVLRTGRQDVLGGGRAVGELRATISVAAST